MAKIFFSYSHDDEQYRDQLEKHLALLKRQGMIEVWHDRRIVVGATLDAAIDQHLESCEIILLLVSASFIASDYCYSREMYRAMERHTDGSARVIPVIVRPCDWQTAPFGKLLAAPKDGKAITTWPNLDEAYSDVARQVRMAIGQLESIRAAAICSTPFSVPPLTTSAQRPSTSVASADLPRSSNLRLKKEFTQLDLDTFLRDTFAFIGRFFQGSLVELQTRNPGIDCRFHQIDGNTFTAAIYKNGKKASECSVHLGSGSFASSSIFYSHDASSRGNSWNESLSIEADDQSLYLKPMGMAFRRPAAHGRLDQEGAAEYFWAMLIERLQ